jgi:hypothetical protein
MQSLKALGYGYTRRMLHASPQLQIFACTAADIGYTRRSFNNYSSFPWLYFRRRRRPLRTVEATLNPTMLASKPPIVFLDCFCLES